MPPSFEEVVKQLRAEYQVLRDRADIFAPGGRQLQDMHVERVERFIFWYGNGPEAGTCIRVVDRPGTLSGDILRLRRHMPAIDGSFEVDGDQVYPIPSVPLLPDWVDDTDLSSSTMARLPLIQADPDKHHIKRVRYESEVLNLLKCQGGSCPGQPKSLHIVQLLGRCSDTEIVFQKWQQTPHLRLGITLGYSSSSKVDRGNDLNAGWTDKSDIYDLGSCIQGIIYGNAPLLSTVEWPVPKPFAAIVEACHRVCPSERPNLDELAALVEAVQA